MPTEWARALGGNGWVRYPASPASPGAFGGGGHRALTDLPATIMISLSEAALNPGPAALRNGATRRDQRLRRGRPRRAVARGCSSTASPVATWSSLTPPAGRPSSRQPSWWRWPQSSGRRPWPSGYFVPGTTDSGKPRPGRPHLRFGCGSGGRTNRPACSGRRGASAGSGDADAEDEMAEVQVQRAAADEMNDPRDQDDQHDDDEHPE
jgi:hypothetical protein